MTYMEQRPIIPISDKGMHLTFVESLFKTLNIIGNYYALQTTTQIRNYWKDRNGRQHSSIKTLSAATNAIAEHRGSPDIGLFVQLIIALREESVRGIAELRRCVSRCLSRYTESFARG
jgi:hypothetical protein